MRRLALVLLVSASTVMAQTPVKDAGVATVIGLLIPGGGQYYAEATGKGLLYTAGAGGAVVMGHQMSHGARDRGYIEPADRRPFAIGAVVGGAIWLLGALDAPNDARRANAKRARVTVVSDPKRLGLAVAF